VKRLHCTLFHVTHRVRWSHQLPARDDKDKNFYLYRASIPWWPTL